MMIMMVMKRLNKMKVKYSNEQIFREHKAKVWKKFNECKKPNVNTLVYFQNNKILEKLTSIKLKNKLVLMT